MLADFFQALESQIAQIAQQGIDDIPLQCRYCLAADGKRSVPKAGHCPADKSNRHGDGFAAAHGTVTDDCVIRPVLRHRPPGECQPLLRGEGIQFRLHPVVHRNLRAPPADSVLPPFLLQNLHIHTCVPRHAADRRSAVPHRRFCPALQQTD